MIPIVAVVTSDHGTTVIGFVASWTNPDLVPPFVANLGVNREKRNNPTLGKRSEELEIDPKPHHVGTDGLSHHAAHRRLHGRGGRQHGRGREQRRGRRSWRKRRGSRRQDGYHGGKHGWWLGHPGLI